MNHTIHQKKLFCVPLLHVDTKNLYMVTLHIEEKNRKRFEGKKNRKVLRKVENRQNSTSNETVRAEFSFSSYDLIFTYGIFVELFLYLQNNVFDRRKMI